jgi:hypothetical protein
MGGGTGLVFSLYQGHPETFEAAFPELPRGSRRTPRRKARGERTEEIRSGGVAEWSKAPVLKTGDGVTHPRVRISSPPPSAIARAAPGETVINKAKLAGHLHLQVTQDYAHTNDDSQRRAMAAFSARMNEQRERGNSAVTVVEAGAVPRPAETEIPRKSRTKRAAER